MIFKAFQKQMANSMKITVHLIVKHHILEKRAEWPFHAESC